MSIVKFFPPIFEKDDHDSNATNYYFHIVYKKGIVPRGAILCQERFELGYKAKRGYFFVDKVKMELIGHAIEVLIAHERYGHNLEEYRESEALALSYYRRFAGRNVEDILESMKKVEPIAKEWIDNHLGFVRWAVGEKY